MSYAVRSVPTPAPASAVSLPAPGNVTPLIPPLLPPFHMLR
jgi:hypothetical protein